MNDVDEQVTTYRPDNALQRGRLAVGRDIWTEIVANRWLTYQLFKRDFLATYKQSLIGVLWAVIIPLAGVATIVLLSNAGVLAIGPLTAPYPIYAVLGLAFWQLFATGLITCSHALVNAGPMLVKVNFSKKSLVLAAAGQAGVPFAIQLLLLAVLCAYYRLVPDPSALLLPLLVLPCALLMLGLGFILALLNGVLRDTAHVVSLALTFLMLLTPVLYAKPQTGWLARMSDYNPLYYLVAVPRDAILTGTWTDLDGYLLAGGASLIVFAICSVLFHLTETRVTERL